METKQIQTFTTALDRLKTLRAILESPDPKSFEICEHYLKPKSISSVLFAPIFIGGEVFGALGVEHFTPNDSWSLEDQDFVSSIADLIALKARSWQVEQVKQKLESQTRQISELQKGNLLVKLIAGVAHDFNNLLSVVLGNAELLDMGAESPDEEKDCIKEIARAAKRGMLLTKEIMAFAKPSQSASNPISPFDAICEDRKIFETALGNQNNLLIQGTPHEGRVHISPTELERVVLNLVVNAKDAMPNGGSVLIQTGLTQLSSGERIGQYAFIQITDQGTGIPQELLPKIFDPFFTSKPASQGTGLGLAIVKQIVESAHGMIEVTTQEGAGTTFKILLPDVS